MDQSYHWNLQPENHPKSRLLKYAKASKISRPTLQTLLQIRKRYHRLPPILYSRQDCEDITLEYDIFGQQLHVSLKNNKAVWQPTSFHVADSIYKQIESDLFASNIDNDSVLLALFPIYVELSRKKQLNMGQQAEEIFLPSTIPSTRHDLAQLHERFDVMLYKEEALEIGLCPKRRRIYNDLFDELIRTITLQCAERGLLLARIKNEFLQWMSTYEEVYSSGMAYGLRQYLCKTEEKRKYEHVIRELESDCRQLQAELEVESERFEKVSQKLTRDNEHEQSAEQRLLKKNVNILRSTNEILQRDLHNALSNILSSSIFLGEPINYDKNSE